MITHVTFNALAQMSGAWSEWSIEERMQNEFRLACTWIRLIGGDPVPSNLIYRHDLANGVRPTCIDCLVHLDAVLEVST